MWAMFLLGLVVGIVVGVGGVFALMVRNG